MNLLLIKLLFTYQALFAFEKPGTHHFPEKVSNVGYSTSEKYIATLNESKNYINVYHFNDKTLFKSVDLKASNFGSVQKLIFSQNDRYLVILTFRGALRIIDLKSSKPSVVSPVPHISDYLESFALGNKYLYFSIRYRNRYKRYESSIYKIELNMPSSIKRHIYKYSIESLELSEDENRLLVSSYKGAEVLETKSDKSLFLYPTKNKRDFTRASFSPNGKRILISSVPGIEVINANTFKSELKLNYENYEDYNYFNYPYAAKASFSPNGKTIFIPRPRHSSYLIDAITGKKIFKYRYRHNTDINYRFSNKGKYLAFNIENAYSEHIVNTETGKWAYLKTYSSPDIEIFSNDENIFLQRSRYKNSISLKNFLPESYYSCDLQVNPSRDIYTKSSAPLFLKGQRKLALLVNTKTSSYLKTFDYEKDCPRLFW